MILLWLLSWPILLYIYIYKCVYHVIASFISHDVPISNGWIFHWRVISQVIFSVDFTWQWTMDNPNWLSTKHRYAKPTMSRSCSLETGDPGDPGETKTIFMSIYWMIFQKHPNIISKWLRVCICIFVCGTMYIYIYMYLYIYIYVRRSKLNSCGEVMASLHKAPYRYTQSQHPFHQLGRIAARRRRIQMRNRILIPLAVVSPEKFKFLRDHQGWRRQLQLETSRTHCRSSDLGGCPWLVLACLACAALFPAPFFLHPASFAT